MKKNWKSGYLHKPFREKDTFKEEEKSDCGEGTCKQIYYKTEEKHYWCKKCLRISQVPKQEIKKHDKKPISKNQKLCPECGASVTNLQTHMNRNHGENQICPQCGQEYKGNEALKCHINAVHSKVESGGSEALVFAIPFFQTNIQNHPFSLNISTVGRFDAVCGLIKLDIKLTFLSPFLRLCKDQFIFKWIFCTNFDANNKSKVLMVTFHSNFIKVST